MAKKPAYLTIADTLRSQIEQREYAPGDRLPSERELVTDFGVARMTVRHALELLQDEGVIDRRRGRTGGTFVRELPPVLDLTSTKTLTEQFAEQAIDVVTEVLAEGINAVPPVVEHVFGVPAGTKIYTRETLYSVHGRGIVFEQSFHRGADTRPGTRTGTRTGTSRRGLRREDVLSSARPSDVERARLELTAATALQRVTRRVYDADTIVACSLISVRPDAAQLRVVTEISDTRCI